MRNLFAVLIALITFTISVVVINYQFALPDAPLSFDIRNAAELLAQMVEDGFNPGNEGAGWPYAARAAIGGFGLSLVPLLIYSLLAR